MHQGGNVDKLVLTLYVARHTPRSMRAISNIRKICEAVLAADQYQLNIVDVIENPEEAEKKRIMATPTLVKEQPLPERRIIGDLTDVETVLHGLDLSVDDYHASRSSE
jgi:circadian clock protein KaiB